MSKDPIGLFSGEFGFYNYVKDSNNRIDTFGLTYQKIHNKYPEDPHPTDGKTIECSVKNGKLVDKNGNPLHIPGGANFIIDMDGNIKVGLRHVHLANGEPVQAAGSITVKSGNIKQIDNGSAHYRPTDEELANLKSIFKESGLNVDNAVVKSVL